MKTLCLAVIMASTVALATSCQPASALQLTLGDCPQSIYDEFADSEQELGYWPFEDAELWSAGIDDALRDQVFQVVSNWALESCYIPCRLKMCGVALRSPSARAWIYIRYQQMPVPDGITPEAQVQVDLSSMTIVEELKYHSPWPCREMQEEVNWSRGDCPTAETK